MTMTDARATVHTRLQAAYAAAYPAGPTRPLVSSSAAPVDPPLVPVVVILSAGVEPASVACPVRTYRLAVTIAAPAVLDDAALDALLDVTLDALDEFAAWSDVTRGTFLDALPAYQMTVEVTE